MSTSLDLAEFDDADAAAILSWPDAFVASLGRRLLALHSGVFLGEDELAELVRHRVLEAASGLLTALGDHVRDLLVHEQWQEGDELTALVNSGAVQAEHAVLDVGCSTGWMLRSISAARPRRRIGIDVDPRALALGYRFARLEGQPIEFRAGSAHDLPFGDNSFDWVICRNAITYMNQRAALGQMTRVLMPGGFLFLRFENLLYDLRNLLLAKTMRSLCCRLRDLGFGLIHAATGRQSTSLRWSGGRCLCGVYRSGHMLKKDNCRIVQRMESLRCPRFLRRSTQTSILVLKSRGLPAEVLSPCIAEIFSGRWRDRIMAP